MDRFSMNLNRLKHANSARRRQWVLLLLFMLPLTLGAQVFEAQADAKEVVLGKTFELSFSLKDAQGERFKSPDFKDFKLAAGPSETRGISIINGRSSSHQTWIYELEPRRTGAFTIGEATVVVNGKTLSTNPLTIKVTPPRNAPGANPPPGSADNLFIAGEFDRSTVYAGQQITWRIKLYTQLSIEGADIIELPDFEGFYSKEKRRFDTRLSYQTIRGKKYAVKNLHEEALFPLEAGNIMVGSAKVRVGIEQPGAFGVFLGSKPVILQTQPIELKVKPLPGPAPESFSGGVGQYDWEMQTDRDSLSTDDALTLTIALRGNGDSRRFAIPKLVVSSGLEAFEPKVKEEEEYENGEEIVHSKVWEYVILPKEPGEYRLSPALVFFDSDSNRYRTLRADSLPLIRVTTGQKYRSGPPAFDTLPPPPAILPQTNLWEKVSDWFRSPVLWSLLVLPLVVLGFIFLRKKQKTAAPAPTAAPAVKFSRDRFSKAAGLLKSGNPRAFYDALFKALQGYISARFDLMPAQMTQENVRKTLTERNVPSQTIQNLLSVWQTCEQALFAGQTQAAQMESTWRSAESVVQDLEKMYRR